ncbi:MAG: M56 family metallopeptidase, partial [Bacillota bacterium]|nr:M56 family metallopeptidase [Bacillota bacterium]
GCKLPVYLSGSVASPCMFGIFRPSIYLTPKAAEKESCVRYILEHELCHFRHGDHIWSILRGVCLAVYWWDPFVWAAAFLSRADSELACDEAVIGRIGEKERLIYGRTLVSMIAVKKTPSAVICAATTMTSGKNGLKERLNLIVKNPKTFIPALAAAMVIATVSAFGTFTGAQSKKEQPAGAEDPKSYAQTLYDNRNPYIGDAPADVRLLDLMGVAEKLGGFKIELETKSEPYILRINFTEAGEEKDAEEFDDAMRQDAALLLTLIGNVSEVQWKRGNSSGSLSVAEADEALKTDVKSCGKTVSGVQSLIDKTGSGITYTLAKLGKNGDVLYESEALGGSDKKLAEDIIFDYMVKSAGRPAIDPKTLDGCLRLNETRADGKKTDYYAFFMDGYAVMQAGTNSHYSRIDGKLYQGIADLAKKIESASSKTADIDRTDLDASISDALLSYYKEDDAHHWYETAGEGHITLETEEKGGLTYAYILERYYVFGFQNGILTDIGGHANPSAIIFSKDGEGRYIFKELIRPKDGSEFGPSLKKMFSASAYKKYLAENNEKNAVLMDGQAAKYAEAYLKLIGRKADVKLQLDRLLPKMNTDVSNYMLDAYGEYPYWIGTLETVEKGIRFVYEKSWRETGAENGIVTFRKSVYGGGEVEKTVIEVKDGKMKCLEGTLREQNYSKYHMAQY